MPAVHATHGNLLSAFSYIIRTHYLRPKGPFCPAQHPFTNIDSGHYNIIYELRYNRKNYGFFLW